MSNNFKKHKKTIVIGAVIFLAVFFIAVLFALNDPDSQTALRGRSWIILLGLVVVMIYSAVNLLKKKSKRKKKRK